MSEKSLKQSELLNLQTNADVSQNKENSNSELVERHEIPNTPFHIVGNKEKGYFLTLGKYKISDTYKTEEELFEDVDKQHWNITLRLITTVHEAIMTKIGEEFMQTEKKQD